jgi:hypothetical protein
MKVLSAAILKRNPLILRKPNDFEREFALYSKQKNTTDYPSNFFKLKKESTRPLEELDNCIDGKDLNRNLDRTLYLVVRNGEDYEFPVSEHVTESLVESAKKVVNDLGSNLRFWSVGNAPIAFMKTRDAKIFFMKSQIFSGKIIHEDYLWLTKEELSQHLNQEYFESIKDALSNN